MNDFAELLDRLRAVHEAVPVPLAIHGGTGFPREAIAPAIAAGVAKFNVGTALRAAFHAAIEDKEFLADAAKARLEIIIPITLLLILVLLYGLFNTLRDSLVALAGLLLLAGCETVTLTNLTPPTMPENPSQIYTFSLRVTPRTRTVTESPGRRAPTRGEL